VCSLTAVGFRPEGNARANIERDLTRCREQAGALPEELAEQVAREWISR
jgi:hypothetical protein